MTRSEGHRSPTQASCVPVGELPAVCSASQDLLFASQLVKETQVSAEVLLEALRLLLPVLPESELLSITDALCSRRQQAPSSSEEEPSE